MKYKKQQQQQIVFFINILIQQDVALFDIFLILFESRIWYSNFHRHLEKKTAAFTFFWVWEIKINVHHLNGLYTSMLLLSISSFAW